MQTNEPAGLKEFTQPEFDTYRAKMAPYDRIIDEGGMLSEQDAQCLKDMRMELWKRFTQDSLDQYNIVGSINSTLSVDDLRKRFKWEKEIDDERRDLEVRLDEGRANGTLGRDEEKRMSRRRDEICYTLDPTHFHGPPP
ncbi:hypothetical protein COV19_07415 [Candidatus Woesearchaeota archaeon CG10_big_fil_rev_8_21_14_0_10_44_13]|nr:MAG: hypothetical protein COV19_07415 [Candidatus Woesearchaeota archaeon CG10_big_fil_rev_8_21_14_0_10_44_13]